MKKTRFLSVTMLFILLSRLEAEGGWTRYTIENSPLLSNRVFSVAVDEGGVKWLGTDRGLQYFDGANWGSIDCDDGLSNVIVRDIVVEGSSRLWLATDQGAFLIILPSECTTHFLPDNSGLISGMVSAIAIDTEAIKWFGTDSGISIFDDLRWRSYSINDYLLNNDILCIASATDGWNYIGTKGRGVNRMRLDGFDVVTTASPYDTEWSGLVSDSVYTAFIASDGGKWFGTPSGASRHEGEETKINWRTYRQTDGLLDDLVLSIAEDDGGILWFGTAKGISCFDGNKWTRFDSLGEYRVFDIATDQDGSIWFATDGGLEHFQERLNAVDRICTGETLPIHNIKIYPHPVHHTATIVLGSNGNDAFRVTIHDLLGRVVRNLMTERTSVSTCSVFWNGRDDWGREVSAGIYFVRMEQRSNRAVKKMIVVD